MNFSALLSSVNASLAAAVPKQSMVVTRDMNDAVFTVLDGGPSVSQCIGNRTAVMHSVICLDRTCSYRQRGDRGCHT